MPETYDEPLLDLEGMVGFGGGVPSGLKVHPDGDHLIYPVGCTVVVENIESHKQRFLNGHTYNVSCVAVSNSGKYLASGQLTHIGFMADIIIWDYATRSMYCKLVLHRTNVEALAFSANDKYLVSLGGQDDGSVVVWNVSTKESICGHPAQPMSAGLTHTLACANTCDETFVTGGNGTLRVWKLDVPSRKIRPSEVRTGQLKRVIKCIDMSADDMYFYCGTTTGDIMKVNMQSFNCQSHGPEKGKFSLGISAIKLLKSGDLLVGSGKGTVAVVCGKNFKKTNKEQDVSGSVTSIALRGAGHQFLVGTNQCNIYKFSFESFKHELKTTCHYDIIYDLAFPHAESEMIATCSRQDIRLWSLKKGKELLRITVPNMTCNAIAIMNDGKSIISGWEDGRIRAFAPESGRPMYTMESTYGKSVTALATYNNCQRIVSGSNLGHVVVWDVPTDLSKGHVYVNKHFLMKEHQAEVTCIKVKNDDTECVTSSTDGSCIIWDLVKQSRRQMIRVNTLFKYVCYNHEQNQVITTGSDRKVGYWETSNASMIRELDGSKSGSVNCMDISTTGKYFVSGGDDKLIKLWDYDDGYPTHIGIGHSASVTGIKISPDEKFIISVSEDGAILKWSFPFRC